MSIRAPSRDEISPTFSGRDLDDEQQKLFTQLQSDFSLIESRLNYLPASRLKSIALTELEKAAMCAAKAVSRMRDVDSPR